MSWVQAWTIIGANAGIVSVLIALQTYWLTRRLRRLADASSRSPRAQTLR
jgi:uncharacterized membrane protein